MRIQWNIHPLKQGRPIRAPLFRIQGKNLAPARPDTYKPLHSVHTSRSISPSVS